MSEPLDDVARAMVDLVRTLKALHEEATRELGLRLEMPAMGVLATLERGGSQRVSAVAEDLRLDLSTISRQVAALERGGLVERERDPQDSRASLLGLTDLGLRTILDVRSARTTAMARRLPNWSDEELSALATTLTRLTDDLRTEPASPDLELTR